MSKSLGSEKEPVWEEKPSHQVQDYEGSRLKIIEMKRLLHKAIRGSVNHGTDSGHGQQASHNDEFLQSYMSLGKALLPTSLWSISATNVFSQAVQ